MYTVRLTLEDIEKLPNFRKRTTSNEYSSACPVCGGDVSKDTDRFRFWLDRGNYWCRKCELRGFVVTEEEKGYGYTSSDWYKKSKEVEERQAKAEEERIRDAKEKISKMNASQYDIEYHAALMKNGDMLEYVMANWGLTVDMVKKYMIGYANVCPTYNKSDSITIPVYFKNMLFNIKHRLLRIDDKGGRYRPQIAGIPPALYNVNALNNVDEAIVVEGEFKSMVVQDRTGIATVGTPSATIFKDKWLKFFDRIKKVYVVLDPDASTHAESIANKLASVVGDVRLVATLTKPDDFFVLYGGTAYQFESYLRFGRRV